MNAIIDHKLDESGAYRPQSLMREPSVLMRPERLAALQPSRVSATRSIIARAARGRWTITRQRFDLDHKARGIALYRIEAGSCVFSFVVHSFEPTAKGRTGRIIGTAWDMMGSLIEGEVTERDIELVGQEMPLLYHGRAAPETLIWCRSNRSGRVFDSTVAALAAGRQPDTAELAEATYIMRNTGLDGNGTFGTKSFLAFAPGHPLRPSLSAQMLTAYMMRVFALDLAHHLARAEGGSTAVELDEQMARYLGVGNGSALGLMFYVNNHPRLVDRWLRAHEQALAQAKLSDVVRGDGKVELLLRLIDKAIVYREQDRTQYTDFTPSRTIADDLRGIRKELVLFKERSDAGLPGPILPLADFAASLEGRYVADAVETFNSALIELVPDYADQLVDTLAVDEELIGKPEMSVARLREIIHADYGWAFGMDLTSERSRRYVWYKSANAEEPRRGLREEAPDAFNLGLDLPRLVVALDRDLAETGPRSSVARFLLTRPQHRRIVARVQALRGLPYHSPHADIMSEDFIPAHMTRLLNGAIHGLDKTQDAMGRVLRGVLMQGAPLPAEVATGSIDPHWFHPAEPVL
ncbi:hypothetical protein MesoLjLc_09260 [Mesorhizobium sp. L-8-10]|uniref:hypothetical protein n=1 Tax=Mesorhizobium sp. L-8-10 TaxID=2744523 RepID=UPI0019285A51|nr:hypothetical protein [Mesorhizobium sp. L-8-10]BCH28996.1 hypothetical protein MesoLjLc_09260 [Mesorhizobium sp. L-8-10]